MLLELKVKNFAIIDEVNILFGEGLNILSGETGSGKSIILKSLSLLMGQKAFSNIVKQESDKAVVEGAFDLKERPDILEKLNNMGIDTQDGQLIIRRIIFHQKKSRIYLNGHLSTLSHLREIVAPLIEITGAPLIEMTGQHDSIHLQSRNYHLDTLDRYIGSWKLRQKIEENYFRIKKLNEDIKNLKMKNSSQHLDFLLFQRDEIKNLNLKPGEEEELEKSVKRMRNSSRLLEFLENLENSLYNNDDAVLTHLQNILQQGQTLEDPELNEKLKDIQLAKTLIEESVHDLRNYGNPSQISHEALNEYEHRLSQLRRLQKKHGKSINEILESLQHIEQEIYQIENLDTHIQSLTNQRDSLQKSTYKLAEELHQQRQKGAAQLSPQVNKEFLDLNMKGLLFDVQVKKLDDLQVTGMTQIEFIIKTSKEGQWQALVKVASGGELSRILLSLKQIIGDSLQPRTYLFDEVDTGVSGLTAEKVGKKLKSISKGQQVICVTHLPQVAVFADHHYSIEKNNTKTGLKIIVKPLDRVNQIKEVARLVSGEKITQTSLKHAQQLLGL